MFALYRIGAIEVRKSYQISFLFTPPFTTIYNNLQQFTTVYTTGFRLDFHNG